MVNTTRTKSFITGGLLCLTISSSASPRVLPLANASLAGGSSWMDGIGTGFKGNARLELLPVIELNDRHALLPVIRGAYLGSQTARQIQDEPTLFEQEQNYQAELGWLYRFAPDWKWVTTVGAGWTFLHDASDEKWGQGLYDHRSAFVSTAVEKRWPRARRPGLVRIGTEVSQTLFPNYESLSSASGDTLAGRHTLDVNEYQLFLDVENSPTPRLFSQGRLAVAVDPYLDQRTLNDDGTYSGTLRKDVTTVASGQLDASLSPWRIGKGYLQPTLGLALHGETRTSNQNEIVGGRLPPISHYYDYKEVGGGPLASLVWEPSGTTFSMGFDWTGRRYRDRPADPTGNDLSRALKTVNMFGFLRLSVPVKNHLRATASVDRLWSDANAPSGVGYNFHYSTLNYLVGMAYEY